MTVVDLQSRTVSEVLPCVLTDDEQRERGHQLADAIKAVNDEETAQKAEKEKMKDRLASLQGDVDRLAEVVRDSSEERTVHVRIDYDEPRSLVHKTRLDTGELIATRAMTDDEKQRALPFSRRAN